ncbi:MAG: TonB-dependent receptor, partial [Tannerella sp.]|nr:TonB-dependent receptor [Tannerella sp.]
AQDGGYWLEETLTDPNRFQPQYMFGTPREGDFVYVDQNNDGVIDEKDQVPLGYGSIPRITWGASVSAQYKGFDCYIFFQGLVKYSQQYAGGGVYENAVAGSYWDYHQTAWTRERWENGDKITYPALSSGATTNHISNSFFVQDRSFARFKNAEIGYTLPNNLLKTLGISKIRVFVSGQNIFIWSPKFRTTHLDPETNGSAGYPTTRSFGFGTNITF